MKNHTSSKDEKKIEEANEKICWYYEELLCQDQKRFTNRIFLWRSKHHEKTFKSNILLHDQLSKCRNVKISCYCHDHVEIRDRNSIKDDFRKRQIRRVCNRLWDWKIHSKRLTIFTQRDVIEKFYISRVRRILFFFSTKTTASWTFCRLWHRTLLRTLL